MRNNIPNILQLVIGFGLVIDGMYFLQPSNVQNIVDTVGVFFLIWMLADMYKPFSSKGVRWALALYSSAWTAVFALLSMVWWQFLIAIIPIILTGTLGLLTLYFVANIIFRRKSMKPS